MAISITPFGILVLLLAIFVPPLGVLLECGLGKDFLINVLLTILGYIPGIIHAVYIIMTSPSNDLKLA